MARFIEEIKKGKFGLVVGGLKGFLVGKYLIPLTDMQSLFATQSVFDSVVGTTSVAVKSVWFFTLLGAIIGYTIERNYDQIRRFFSRWS